MKIIISIAALAVSVSAVPAPMSANPDRTRTVRYSDLDLARESDRAALDRRLHAAVRSACGEASAVNLKGRNEIRRCRAATKALVARQRENAVASASRKSPTEYASER